MQSPWVLQDIKQLEKRLVGDIFIVMLEGITI